MSDFNSAAVPSGDFRGGPCLATSSTTQAIQYSDCTLYSLYTN